MFIPDVPVDKVVNDQLGRADFARKLGMIVRDWDRSESIVIALYSPWGNGKTSLINMALETIDETTANWEVNVRPIVIKFNPWNFTDSNQLIRAFFVELVAAIQKRDKKKGEEIKRSVNTLAKRLSNLEDLPGVGNMVSGIAKAVAGATGDEELDSVRAKISKQFLGLNRRVVIVLDDIDRLSESEIRLVFRLVKLNADFPNTIYILAFSRDIVEKALSNEQGISGRDYLEKIVQVGFDVPRIDPSRLASILSAELDKVLNKLAQIRWHDERWASLYSFGIRHLLGSLRDVKRYVNALAFNLAMIDPAEIDVVDFLGLEGLRVFLPEVYEWVSDNKGILTNSTSAGTPGEIAAIKESIESVVNASPHPEAARAILQQLFPQLSRIYSNMWYGREYHPIWRKDRRLCSSDVFDYYFYLGIPEGEVGDLEMRQLFLLADDPSKVAAKLRSLEADGRIARCLDLLDDYFPGQSEDRLLNLAQALLDLAETMPNRSRGVFDIGTDLRLGQLVYEILLSTKQPRRLEWMRSMILANSAMFMPVYIVSASKPRADGDASRVIFDESEIAILQTDCVTAIQRRADDNSLLRTKRAAFLLSQWRAWSPKPDALEKYVNENFGTVAGALGLVAKFVYEERSQTLGEVLPRFVSQINLDAIFPIVSEPKLRKLLEDARAYSGEVHLSSEQKQVLELLSNAFAQRSTATGVDE